MPIPKINDLKNELQSIVDMISNGETPDISTADLIDLSARLKSAGRLAKVIDAYIINDLRNGDVIPGYKLVHTRGRAKISDQREAIRRIIKYLADNPECGVNIDDLLQTAPLSKLNGALGNEAYADLFLDIISNNNIGEGYDYALETDSRPAVRDDN